MMKRAIDLGYEAPDPINNSWYYLTDEDFEDCLTQLGQSSRLKNALIKTHTNNNHHILPTTCEPRLSNKDVESSECKELQHPIRYDVFLSSKSEDYPLAEAVYEYLSENGFTVFAASKELDKIGEAAYADAINSALDTCMHMIVIASSSQNLHSKWVKHEWSTFSNDLNSGYRDGNLLTILDNISPKNLPAGLRHQQSFKYESFKDGRILGYLKPSTGKLPLSREEE